MVNQARMTYANAVSSAAKRNSRKTSATILKASVDFANIGFANKEPFTHLGELALDLTISKEAKLA